MAEASGPRLLNRQLSWLAFNRRVLALAEDVTLPFADRMRFVSIWASNLDEYFLVRIASLRRDARAGRMRFIDDGLSSSEQFEQVRVEVNRQRMLAESIAQNLRQDMTSVGFRLADWDDLDASEQADLSEFFNAQVFPVLTPLAVDPGHPFPYISTHSLNLGLLLADPVSGVPRFARVKVPTDLLGRHVRVGGDEPSRPNDPTAPPTGPSDRTYVPLEQVVSANIDRLFPGVEVLEHTIFRVTRNADISVTADSLDDHDDDLLTAIESELRQRRHGAVTRVQISAAASAEMRSILSTELECEQDTFFAIDGMHDLGSYCAIDDLVGERRDFFLERFPPRVPPAFAGVDSASDFFSVVRERDVFVHHPYDSFDDSVLAFINAASDDPDVQAIKLTLYRTSGDSSIVAALIRAAEAGKQVVVVVELKARFDEAANIEWARALEQAGVHVAYGFIALKIHTKTCLVVRREGGTLRRYCHFGTGNYNSRTAGLYTDFGLFTSDPDYGEDLSALFNSLTGFHVPVDYNELVVAPADMRARLEELIANEARFGRRGHIRAKMNSLVDPELIEALYAASRAGVRIELIVRGQCCLRPGVPGLSETITVRSILGRYLEHARAYSFGNGDGEGIPHLLIGSADLMGRNLDRRVEALVPVADPECAKQLNAILDANLTDDRRAWSLRGDGSWVEPDPSGTMEMHVLLHD
ncbi:MAG: polyphosphate kinase 1 [Actinomycetota bacterium]